MFNFTSYMMKIYFIYGVNLPQKREKFTYKCWILYLKWFNLKLKGCGDRYRIVINLEDRKQIVFWFHLFISTLGGWAASFRWCPMCRSWRRGQLMSSRGWVGWSWPVMRLALNLRFQQHRKVFQVVDSAASLFTAFVVLVVLQRNWNRFALLWRRTN